ncbi:carbohydrate sulfotransferase 4-like [Mya arenaria]|uniref:carbohydrate sulfotransferase 4-like n=1 Tax=Mya arenaria TaxID=6604 RepID=UPI0022E6DD41|nr:carbohydrate sulfotransferase 4-like [Mya arenaria]
MTLVFNYLKRRRKRLVCLAVISGLILFCIWIGTSDESGEPKLEDPTVITLPLDTNGKFNVGDDIILSAYMNSGSRFTGRLLGFRPDTFYFYEPLYKFSVWDYFAGKDMRCSTVIGECRRTKVDDINFFRPNPYENTKEKIVKKIPNSLKPTELLLSVVSKILSCDLVPLKDVIQDRVQELSSYVGPSWKTYRDCLSRFIGKSVCLRDLQDVCRRSTVRFIKLLRLTLGSLQPLLENNEHLKVVHLFRDPRAIIHSRMYTRYYPTNEKEQEAVAKGLCDKMLKDYFSGVKLMKQYPGRVMFLYYEDLLEHLHVRLKELYSLLNIEYNATLVDHLAEINVNLAPAEKGISFRSDRQGNNSIWWRKYMTWDDVASVEAVCGTAMRYLGYTSFDSVTQLRDLTVSSYRIPQMFHLTDIISESYFHGTVEY